tara:strand:- start:501 stop:713 length:213 start_codon:yes stop_codon:yes gene_type:complete
MQTDKVNEAQMVLFQIARKNAGEYSESQVNNNASLRRRLAKKILDDAKESRPDISSETWAAATVELNATG